MTIEAVVFDIGNVLIEWQPERYYDRVLGEERRRQMFAEVDLHGMNDLVDQGHHFTDTIYGWAEKYPEWRDQIRDWHDNWIELASPEIPHSVRLLRALRNKGVPVFALTNFGVQNFDYACTVYPFLTEFDRAYVSGRMQMVKPHAPIYAAVEDDCGLAPGTLLFADDRVENIDAARMRGWQVHHFTGPQGWAARLVAEGLLTEGEAA
ncbi:HAD family phosphatase [Ruegeria pomeroyi]|uniref:HAD family phosphatase n=2 Tax=Ruegeria TaxID=97050 RepID=A0A9Q3WR25_9RHOB|nr:MULTISPECIES: HAD family phosphatase [Ruegeria]MCE8510402.1 HAD family phosphatase [Ruegeria pomeroyi]MCE8514843.1 HAD family phosphatase [Ruegeria pomeroyi]MCE8519154.1 HAD family phosphatase [Ruegeria pomeroyi]MCE8523415.1 HAD family phosphatase [Ruegeria pomeroyi]MCE8527474.1 HAD family phosphatase [Ruegeria pomeroyi]